MLARRVASGAVASALALQSLGRRGFSEQPVNVKAEERRARIAVLGAGWWSQGWHLPHLSRNPEVTIAAIVEPNPNPRSAINALETVKALGNRYCAPTFASLDEALAASLDLDGLLVCTSHASHFELGIKGLDAGLHILMEKPMTTDVEEGRKLASAAASAHQGRQLAFMINNTANFRQQCKAGSELVRERRRVGDVQHVQCTMHSALLWLFDNPANVGWTQLSGKMLGNGFAWGQLSHLLAFVFQVTGLVPTKVFAHMSFSQASGGDLSDSVVIICEGGASISLSGSCAVPGDAHGADANLGKYVGMRVFGSEGMLAYEGYDQTPKSGSMQLTRRSGHIDQADEEVLRSASTFAFENYDQEGLGPESLLAFVDACLGREHFVGASAETGLAVVRTIDAMYRSAKSGQVEACT